MRQEETSSDRRERRRVTLLRFCRGRAVDQSIPLGSSAERRPRTDGRTGRDGRRGERERADRAGPGVGGSRRNEREREDCSCVFSACYAHGIPQCVCQSAGSLTSECGSAWGGGDADTAPRGTQGTGHRVPSHAPHSCATTDVFESPLVVFPLPCVRVSCGWAGCRCDWPGFLCAWGPAAVRRARARRHVQKEQQRTRRETLYTNLMCQCQRLPLFAGRK
jgi:hypothetical protein